MFLAFLLLTSEWKRMDSTLFKHIDHSNSSTSQTHNIHSSLICITEWHTFFLSIVQILWQWEAVSDLQCGAHHQSHQESRHQFWTTALLLTVLDNLQSHLQQRTKLFSSNWRVKGDYTPTLTRPSTWTLPISCTLPLLVAILVHVLQVLEAAS